MGDSRIKIANALKTLAQKNDLNKISVDEIISVAGISRQTFYKYFSDKYDLAFWIYTQDVSSKAVDHFKTCRNFAEMNRLMLNTLKDNKEFYRNMFKNQNVQNSFFSQFHQLAVSETINMIGHYNMTKELTAILEVYCTGTDLLIANWLINGIKEDIDWIVDILCRAMPGELKPFLMSESST